MRRVLEVLNSVLPFLERYPPWVTTLVAMWMVLTAALLVTMLLVARRPASIVDDATGRNVVHSSPGANIFQAGRDIVIGASTAPVSEAFLVRQHSAILANYPGPLFYLYESKNGKKLAPVGYAVVIEIVNKSASPTGIHDYMIDASIAGEWVRLPNLGALNFDQFYFASRDLADSKRLDFTSTAFDVVARGRVLAPGESVRGWMFFEWPRGFRSRQGNVVSKLRVHIESTTALKQSTVLDPSEAREKGGSVLPATGVLSTGETVDLSEVEILPHIDLLDGFREGSIK